MSRKDTMLLHWISLEKNQRDRARTRACILTPQQHRGAPGKSMHSSLALSVCSWATDSQSHVTPCWRVQSKIMICEPVQRGSVCMPSCHLQILEAPLKYSVTQIWDCLYLIGPFIYLCLFSGVLKQPKTERERKTPVEVIKYSVLLTKMMCTS